jgi:hypothetical protein
LPLVTAPIEAYSEIVRAAAILAPAAAVLIAAAACVGGSSSHATLTEAQAIAQARADGFADPVRRPPVESWRCAPHEIDIGPVQTTGRYARYTRPLYSIELGDKRAPTFADRTARIGMIVNVFHSADFAAACAKAEMQTETSLTSHGKPVPYKVISATTIEHGMHPAGPPGSRPGQTGQFVTSLADGRVFALGIAYNEHDSRIVQDDLARLAHEIAG